MRSKTTALRLQVESALAGRVPSPFDHRTRKIVETVPLGIPSLDFLTGGLPRGSLTEICGPPCSGRTSLLLSALAARTAASEVCALVDARDSFDPHSAQMAGVRLQQLLWVRCRDSSQAFRATDLLIQGGGFGLIALDLGDAPPQVIRRIPLQVWFRFRRAVENTPTVFVVLDRESSAGTCASLILRLQIREAKWSHTHGKTEEIILPHAWGCLLKGAKNHAEMIASREKHASSGWMPDGETFPVSRNSGVDFETEAIWNHSRALPGRQDSGGGAGIR